MRPVAARPSSATSMTRSGETREAPSLMSAMHAGSFTTRPNRTGRMTRIPSIRFVSRHVTARYSPISRKTSRIVSSLPPVSLPLSSSLPGLTIGSKRRRRKAGPRQRCGWPSLEHRPSGRGWSADISELHNPFRGTRSRPASKATRKLSVPTDAEIEALEAGAAPWLRTAIVVMSKAGLRVGGLPGLSINGVRWTTTSKGKDHSGTVPDEVREAITRAKLPLRSPFGGYSAEKIAKAFKYLVRKTYGETRYSVHDLRHAIRGQASARARQCRRH